MRAERALELGIGSEGVAFAILEMNFFRPDRIMFIFSAVPFYYSLSSFLDLHDVENCWDLFFSRDHVFKSVFAEF